MNENIKRQRGICSSSSVRLDQLYYNVLESILSTLELDDYWSLYNTCRTFQGVIKCFLESTRSLVSKSFPITDEAKISRLLGYCYRLESFTILACWYTSFSVLRNNRQTLCRLGFLYPPCIQEYSGNRNQSPEIMKNVITLLNIQEKDIGMHRDRLHDLITTQLVSWHCMFRLLLTDCLQLTHLDFIEIYDNETSTFVDAYADRSRSIQSMAIRFDQALDTYDDANRRINTLNDFTSLSTTLTRLEIHFPNISHIIIQVSNLGQLQELSLYETELLYSINEMETLLPSLTCLETLKIEMCGYFYSRRGVNDEGDPGYYRCITDIHNQLGHIHWASSSIRDFTIHLPRCGSPFPALISMPQLTSICMYECEFPIQNLYPFFQSVSCLVQLQLHFANLTMLPLTSVGVLNESKNESNQKESKTTIIDPTQVETRWFFRSNELELTPLPGLRTIQLGSIHMLGLYSILFSSFKFDSIGQFSTTLRILDVTNVFHGRIPVYLFYMILKCYPLLESCKIQCDGQDQMKSDEVIDPILKVQDVKHSSLSKTKPLKMKNLHTLNVNGIRFIDPGFFLPECMDSPRLEHLSIQYVSNADEVDIKRDKSKEELVDRDKSQQISLLTTHIHITRLTLDECTLSMWNHYCNHNNDCNLKLLNLRRLKLIFHHIVFRIIDYPLYRDELSWFFSQVTGSDLEHVTLVVPLLSMIFLQFITMLLPRTVKKLRFELYRATDYDLSKSTKEDGLLPCPNDKSTQSCPQPLFEFLCQEYPHLTIVFHNDVPFNSNTHTNRSSSHLPYLYH